MTGPASTPYSGAATPYYGSTGGLGPKIKDKSTTTAYLLWFFCGSLHRLYLGDCVGCLVYWLTSGLCFVMLICDAINMKGLVELANHGMDLPLIATKSKFPPAIQQML